MERFTEDVPNSAEMGEVSHLQVSGKGLWAASSRGGWGREGECERTSQGHSHFKGNSLSCQGLQFRAIVFNPLMEQSPLTYSTLKCPTLKKAALGSVFPMHGLWGMDSNHDANSQCLWPLQFPRVECTGQLEKNQENTPFLTFTWSHLRKCHILPMSVSMQLRLKYLSCYLNLISWYVRNVHTSAPDRRINQRPGNRTGKKQMENAPNIHDIGLFPVCLAGKSWILGKQFLKAVSHIQWMSELTLTLGNKHRNQEWTIAAWSWNFLRNSAPWLKVVADTVYK